MKTPTFQTVDSPGVVRIRCRKLAGASGSGGIRVLLELGLVVTGRSVRGKVGGAGKLRGTTPPGVGAIPGVRRGTRASRRSARRPRKEGPGPSAAR
jgi:hypothetical protein